MLQIIALNSEKDDYGVYSTTDRGEFGTPLVFRGTFDQCIDYRKEC